MAEVVNSVECIERVNHPQVEMRLHTHTHTHTRPLMLYTYTYSLKSYTIFYICIMFNLNALCIVL